MTIEKTQTIPPGSPNTVGTRGMIGRFASHALDLVFPARCSLCSNPIQGHSSGQSLCVECDALIHKERLYPACPMCGVSVAPFEVSDGRCRQCRPKRPRTRGTVRVGEYRGALAQLVRLYKYRGQERLGPVLGAWLAEGVRLAPWFDRVEGLVAVPTHWRRRMQRPMHAADALAELVGRQTGLPYISVLRRVRAGRHQIGLSYLDRKENVKGAFDIRPGVQLHRARLLLIDDVKTTGATLNECAKILRRAGAAEIYAGVAVVVQWDPQTTDVPSSI